MTSVPALVSIYDQDVFDLHDQLHELFPGHGVETDPRGAVHLAAASDDHVLAVSQLAFILKSAIGDSASVLVEKFIYQAAPGLTRNEPDVVVLDHSYERVGLGTHPAPLLIAEVASPATRGTDRGRKWEEYRTGGVGLYLLIDPPGLAGSDVQLELHALADGDWVLAASGPHVSFTLAGVPVTVLGADLVRPPRHPPLRSV